MFGIKAPAFGESGEESRVLAEIVQVHFLLQGDLGVMPWHRFMAGQEPTAIYFVHWPGSSNDVPAQRSVVRHGRGEERIAERVVHGSSWGPQLARRVGNQCGLTNNTAHPDVPSVIRDNCYIWSHQ